MDQWLKNYFIDIAMILLIPMVSLWGFLFFKGYYFYADQSWPLSNQVYAGGVLSLNPLAGFAFSRLIIVWPYYITTLYCRSVEVTERIFIYYSFVLYTFFAYILASMITSKLLKSNNKYEIKLVKFIIVIFIFSNFTALNLNADGGSYSDGLNIIFISMILFAFVSWKNMRLAFLLSSLLLTISILIEPDYTTFYVISIILGSTISGALNGEFFHRFKYALLTLLSAIPSGLYIIFTFYLTSGTTNTISNIGAFRIYNYRTISFFSRNIKPLYSILLLGHFWSTIVYAPPNILLYTSNISSVKGILSPSQILLPPGLLTDLWFFSLITIPLISLTSVIFNETRKITLPVIIIFSVFYIMSLVFYIRPLFDFESDVVGIPLIGSFIGTTLSLPGHAINAMAGMYYILFSVTLIEVFNKDIIINVKIKNKIHNILRKNNFQDQVKIFKLNANRARVILVFFIIFVVLFSGWQAFDGTFYPARAPDSIYGNQVANIGGFSPKNINGSVISAYDFISSQKSNFNIIWIGGPAFNNRVYCPPHPLASIPDFSYLTTNNMKSAFYNNLINSETKYVVISNQDINQNDANIYEFSFKEAGLNNFAGAKDFLSNVSGLSQIYNKNQVIIYQVSGFSEISESNLLISCNASNPEYVGIPYLFKTLDYNASLTDTNNGIKFSINKNGSNVIETPSYLSTHYVNKTKGQLFNLSSNETIRGVGHNFPINIGDNYTLTLWSNNETYYNYSKEIVNIHMTGDNGSGTSISYNGSFVGGAGGFYNNYNYIRLNVTFFAKSTLEGRGAITFMGEPRSNASQYNIFYNTNFNVTQTYKEYNFSYIFSSAEQYLDFRLFDHISGTFYVKDLSTKYTVLPKIIQNSSMPFGNYVVLNNTVINGGSKTALIFVKNNTGNQFNWVKINDSRGLLIKNKIDIAAILLLNSKNVLNDTNNSYILSITPSIRAYELLYNEKYYKPISGLYGNSIYVLPKKVNSTNDIKIIEKGKGILELFYLAIMLYLMVLIYEIADIYRKDSGRFGKRSKKTP